MRKLLIISNSTMPKSVGIFNLPPIQTCTPSTWCQKNCYALRNRFAWRNIKDTLTWRYKQSLRDDFAIRVIKEIDRNKCMWYVRIHISGDFYSKKYIDKWTKIAKEFPGIIFRTNTRRTDLLGYMKKVFPKNVVVRESVDSTRKWQGIYPKAAIKGTKGSDKYFVCQDNCEKCNFHCWTHPNINVVTSKIR